MASRAVERISLGRAAEDTQVRLVVSLQERRHRLVELEILLARARLVRRFVLRGV